MKICTYTGKDPHLALKALLDSSGKWLTLRIDWKQLLGDGHTKLVAQSIFEHPQTPPSHWYHQQVPFGIKHLHQKLVALVHKWWLIRK